MKKLQWTHQAYGNLAYRGTARLILKQSQYNCGMDAIAWLLQESFMQKQQKVQKNKKAKVRRKKAQKKVKK